MGKCKYCDKKLPKAHKGSGAIKIFCNNNCKNLWRYHNLPKVNAYYKARSKIQTKEDRQNPIKRAERKAYFEIWRTKNRDKFNESCRKSMRKILKIKPSEHRV